MRVLKTEGHALVTGGPGSGKTTLALVKAKTRIEGGLEPGQSVLFLSFSRAAVARIVVASKTEIPKELQGNLVIQTFHSFFWEILRTHGYLLGAPRRLRLFSPQDERAYRQGAEDDDADWLAERERLFGNGLVVFDLFAPKAHALVERSCRIRHLISDRYPLIIVDEAQDTAEDQWACVKALAEKSQLICLADLEQQIYDFRPGVSNARVEHIIKALAPLRVDLASQNHRSPDAEIMKFGNDILLNTPRGSPYRGVSQIGFQPSADNRDRAIRSSVGILGKKIRELLGRWPESVAVLATWGRGVGIISRALTGTGGTKPIPHQVLIDEASVLLSSRLLAFLLEPKEPGRELIDLAEALDLAAVVFRAKGNTTHLDQARRLAAQAEQARQGKTPSRSKVADELVVVLKELQGQSFTGDPRKDWLQVRRRLKNSSAAPLIVIASEAEQLMAFNRGQRIAAGLVDVWQEKGCYMGARVILNSALVEDQILSGSRDPRGISVMTIHKAKGKEFDGVVIIDEARNCPLTSKEAAPYARSRKLLRVGITRARYHVLMLTDSYNPSKLLLGHNL